MPGWFPSVYGYFMEKHGPRKPAKFLPLCGLHKAKHSVLNTFHKCLLRQILCQQGFLRTKYRLTEFRDELATGVITVKKSEDYQKGILRKSLRIHCKKHTTVMESKLRSFILLCFLRCVCILLGKHYDTGGIHRQNNYFPRTHRHPKFPG